MYSVSRRASLTGRRYNARPSNRSRRPPADPTVSRSHSQMIVTIGRCAVVLLTTTAVALLAGCGDTRIGALSEGIARDSALKVLAGGPSSDSLANVYRQETYLYNSRVINV